MVKMSSGLLSLKWNHHRSTFLHVLANIRQKESYSDVTLACAGKFYPTHKLVLSTCSEYFEEMFDRTQCKHPVIVLKDIGADDLEALLSYMYDGEVNVLQENLSSLIKAAECLKIKGLAVADNDPNERTKEKKLHSSSSNSGSNSSSNSRDVQRNDRRPVSSNGSGIKRSNVNSSSGEDGSQPTKRRRPEARSQHSTPAPSEDKEAASHTDSATTESGATESAADASSSDKAEDEVPADGQGAPEQSEDSQAFIQGLNAETGVKAEPVEVLDELSFDDRDDGEDAGSGQPAGDLTDFTEEKFSGGEGDDPALWSGGDAPDLFSQPSTSNFGEDDSNNDQGGGGKSGNTSSSVRREMSCHSDPWTSSKAWVASADPPNSNPSAPTRLRLADMPRDLASINPVPKNVTPSNILEELCGRSLDPDATVAQLAAPAVGSNSSVSLTRPLAPLAQPMPQSWMSPKNFAFVYPRFPAGVKRGGERQGGVIYACTWPDCNHTSSRREHFKIHMRRHTRERPFRCDHCEYRCNQKGQLKNHLLFKHSIV